MRLRIRRPWHHRQVAGIIILLIGLGITAAMLPLWIWVVLLGGFICWFGWYLLSSS